MDYVEMAEDVLQLIDRLELKRPTLMGHSMGGKVAMALALRHPARIAGLIVVDIAPASYVDTLTPFAEAMRSANVMAAASRSEVQRRLRLAQAAIKNRDIEARTGGAPKDDDQLVTEVLQKMVKQRRERMETRQEDVRPSDPVQRMRQRAEALTAMGAALSRLADAQAPLYNSLDEGQRRRFPMLSQILGDQSDMRRRSPDREYDDDRRGWRGRDGDDEAVTGTRLHQGDEGRPNTPLIRPEKIIRIRGVVADRADAPDEAAPARSLGREKEALRGVAKARLGARVAKDIVLRDDGQDRAQDQVPILADGDWDNRLDVECESVAVSRPDIIVPVCLEGHADQRRDGIRELFGELRGLILAPLCARGGLRGKDRARRYKKSCCKCRTQAHFRGEP
jgi:pimeloyl-ACP methyl ester carboxylesterase